MTDIIAHNQALVVTNGDLSDFTQVNKLRKKCDILIASDGASLHLHNLQIIPDVVIGDFDSSPFPRHRITQTKYIKFPRDKDFTDTELALDYAKSLGYKNIILTGLNGTRVDHVLANI